MKRARCASDLDPSSLRLQPDILVPLRTHPGHCYSRSGKLWAWSNPRLALLAQGCQHFSWFIRTALSIVFRSKRAIPNSEVTEVDPFCQTNSASKAGSVFPRRLRMTRSRGRVTQIQTGDHRLELATIGYRSNSVLTRIWVTRSLDLARQSIFLPTVFLLLTFTSPSFSQTVQNPLQIGEIIDNRQQYPNGRIPRFEKLEISFQVKNTVATNLQLPFDPEPPNGIEPAIGISVEADFTPDNWKTVYRQPAFLYQDFRDEIRGGKEWFYPTDVFSWKVRFAPNEPGEWEYKIIAQDASGIIESEVRGFSAIPSSNPGFVRVSMKDPRYFEFDDGTYFPALGYNMNYDHVSWRNPILDNQEHFRTMDRNGIQLVRIWLSQWAIFGSEWTPWNSQDPAEHGAYLPVSNVTSEESFPGSDVSMKIAADHCKCMFIGLWKARPAVQRNSRYRVQLRYKTSGILGPVDPNKAFGLVAKTGDWLWDREETKRCYAPGTGIVVTPHVDWNSTDWELLEGSLYSGENDFLPDFFIVLENTYAGSAFIDFVSIQEVLADGEYGSNIVSKPWMSHHLYFEQRNSYAFDKLLDLASEHDVYLRPVILEKNDRLFNQIDHEGNFNPNHPSNDHFYGNWREVTKVRWLQKAWWRYLQARWGFSPHIHSWELLNEGDPFNSRHYTLADELGRYMRQFAPTNHLVSTSTWHSLPAADFWENSEYSNIDFADIHLYIPRAKSTEIRIDDTTIEVNPRDDFFDSAATTQKLGHLAREHVPSKPVVRGETGFVAAGSGPADRELERDTEGIWLHNFIWAGLNPNGLIESYWYESAHIYNESLDHRGQFRPFYEFIEGVPLSNGHYQDAEAGFSDPELRVLGQKDLVNNAAHLWIQNKQHTWKNRVDGVKVTPVSGEILVSGFQPEAAFWVVWWDTNLGVSTAHEQVNADRDGTIVLAVRDLHTDRALRISLKSPAVPAPANLRVRTRGSE